MIGTMNLHFNFCYNLEQHYKDLLLLDIHTTYYRLDVIIVCQRIWCL
jgi:hypothetical protein